MSVVLYRIDDRLVHGQVMTAWTKIYQTMRIFVIDDETAADGFLSDVMKMAMPGEYDLRIVNTKDGIAAIQADTSDTKAMVLVKGPKVIKELLAGGVDIKELNVGNMGAGAERRAISRSTQLTPAEYADLQEIADAGVRVYLQMMPDGKAVEWDKVVY